jgi:hypothetical protein
MSDTKANVRAGIPDYKKQLLETFGPFSLDGPAGGYVSVNYHAPGLSSIPTWIDYRGFQRQVAKRQ